MKLAWKATLVGVSVEAALAAMFAAGGFGPCGPSNPLGFIGLLGHLFPGIFVGWAFEMLFPNAKSASTLVLVVTQALFWVALCYVYLRFRARNPVRRELPLP